MAWDKAEQIAIKSEERHIKVWPNVSTVRDNLESK